MKPTCIICSGLITGVLAFILGVAIAEIGQRQEVDPLAYELYGWIGAGVGVLVGAGQEALRQKIRVDQDLGIVDDEPWTLN